MNRGLYRPFPSRPSADPQPRSRILAPLLTAAAVNPNATITGVRALATAAGRPGPPKVQVTGARALANATGTPAGPKIAIEIRVAANATANFIDINLSTSQQLPLGSQKPRCRALKKPGPPVSRTQC